MKALWIASPVAVLARLEAGDVLRSRWLGLCATLYAALAGLFVFVGSHESGVLRFTGMPRVLASLTHALVILLPLLALTGTGFVVNQARRDGTLEVLFSQPVERRQYLGAVTLVRYGVLLLPLVILLPGLALIGILVFGEAAPWGFLSRGLVVCAALLWSFVGIGLAISVSVAEPSKAMAYVLVVWVLAVALLDFGLVGVMLEWRVPAATVFVLAGINPVEMARLALLSGAEPSLETLGPVGLFLIDRMGSGWLFAAGVLWPLLVGTVAWALARRRLQRGDLL